MKTTTTRPFPASLAKHFPALAIYIILSLVLTLPLIFNLTTLVPGTSDLDADQNIWNLSWFKTAVLDRHTNPYYTNLLYYPYWSKGLPLVFHNLQPLNGLLALPVTATGGPLMAFNFIALFTFISTGFTAYLLAFYLLKNRGAALLAGAFYSFAPLHFGYFRFSNMETMSLEWMPLYLLFLHLATGRPDESERPFSRARYFQFAGAGLTLLANALTDWYFTLYMLLYTLFWAIWQLARYRPNLKPVIRNFIFLGLSLAVFTGPIGWLLWQASKIEKDFILVKGVQEEIAWSAAPWSFFVPEKMNELQPSQWTLYFFGWVVLLLVGAALLKKRKIQWWWVVLGLFLILGMGPYLKLSGSSRVNESTGVPLPYFLLRNLPVISISRIVGRFYFVADLAAAILAAYGFLNLQTILETRKLFNKVKPVLKERALLTGILLLWVLEVQTVPLAMYRPEPDQFYTSYLAKNPGQGAVLELPLPKTNEATHSRMLNQVFSGRPIIGGYLSRSLKDYYRADASPFHLVLTPSEITAPPLNGPDFVLPDQQLTLKELLIFYEFAFLVLYREEFEPSQFTATKKTYQQILGPEIYEDARLTAFKVIKGGPLPGPRLYCGENWYGVESKGKETNFRWVKNGSGFVGLVASGPGSGRLNFEAWSFGQDRDLIVRVNGVEATFRLSPVPGPFEFNFSWNSGVNTIEFKTSGPGQVPGNGDVRNLTFSLGNLALK